MSDQTDAEEPFVRPFMITAKRTVGAAGEIPIEAMVIATGDSAGLDPDPARVVSLCSSPMSIAEIAETVERTASSVKVALMRSRRHLAVCIQARLATEGDAR